MAINHSAVRRVTQDNRKRMANKHKLKTMKTAIKRVRKGECDLSKAQSLIARCGRLRVIHPNKAARLIKRLTVAVTV